MACSPFDDRSGLKLSRPGLPSLGFSERWGDQPQHTVLELDFDGDNFIRTCQSWLGDPRRPERLFYFATLTTPLNREQWRNQLNGFALPAALSDELSSPWLSFDGGERKTAAPRSPALPTSPASNLYRLCCAQSRIHLYLSIGDIQLSLKRLRLAADSVILNPLESAPESAPESGPVSAFEPSARYRGLSRLCRLGARLVSRDPSSGLVRALSEAGFHEMRRIDEAGKHHWLAQYQPDWPRSKAATRAMSASSRPKPAPLPKQAVIVGAGLAGSALARALSRRGWRLTVVESDDPSLLLGSTQPVCIEHLHVSPDDNVLARLTRSAWQLSRSGDWFAAGGGEIAPASRGKLMLIHDDRQFARWQAAIGLLSLPAGYLRLLDREQTLRAAAWPVLAGSATLRGALHFGDARAFDPRTLCQAWLSVDPGAAEIQRLRRHVARLSLDQTGQAPDAGRGDQSTSQVGAWTLWDSNDQPIATAPVVILCNAADASRLARLESLLTTNYAGQTSVVRHALPGPQLAIGGAAYLCPSDAHTLVLGASFESAADFASSSAADQDNFVRCAQSLAISGEQLRQGLGPLGLTGAAGARCMTRDHLPIVGAWPDEQAAGSNRSGLLSNAKLPLPTLPGLYANFGHGARGLLWCTLAAELLSARLHGEPLPISGELAAAIDPARQIRTWLRQSNRF